MKNCEKFIKGGVVAISLMAEPVHAAAIFGNSFDSDPGNTLNLNGNQVSVSVSNTAWYWGTLAETVLYPPAVYSQSYYVADVNEPGVYGIAFKNYFVFDISALNHSIASASITLNSYDVSGKSTYSLFGFPGAISDLLSGNNSGTTYNQMGTGTVYGSYNYSPTDSNQYRTITLDGAFVSDINAAISNHQQFFAIDGVITHVPEPSSILFIVFGLAGFAAMRHKHVSFNQLA